MKQAMIGTSILMAILSFQNCGKLAVDISGEDASFLSSTGASYKFVVMGPSAISIGQCAAYYIDRTSLNGGSLPAPASPYPTEIVTVPAAIQSMFYLNETCTVQAPAALSTDDLPAMGYFMSTSAYQGDIYLLVSGRPTNKIQVTAQ